MADNETREVLKNIDQRLERVEQVLPTLATKDELKTLATKDELKALATKDDLKALATKDELKTLATKDELKAFATKEDLDAAVARLATKDELNAAEARLDAKIAEEGDRSRRYMKVLNEEIKATVKVYAEHLVAVDARDAHQHAETLKRHVALEGRVTALEAKRARRRG